MSPPGRPKGSYRSAKHEGTPASPPGRAKGECRRAKPEGIPADRRAAEGGLGIRPLPAALLGLGLVALLAGCAAPPAPPPAPPPIGLTELMQQPAERALLDGIRAYDDGRYPQAEAALNQALALGLKSARDRATAHKLLAFITCTSERVDDCRTQFRQARAADAGFALSRSEAGHPLWGPVYRSTTP